ncbi:MAG: TetR/AcrR family transcriptional regulator [Alphaproteobacteria bacterium]|nr:TetR/AcrR family transcriptional regulator [Alphaproteobacteria bacterium]
MGRKKTYDRNNVLEKAMLLFWEKGYEGAHLSELVEVTGLNRFGLYKEFDGKMGLFEAALERYLAGAETHYINFLNAEPAGLENIRRYFDALSFSPDYHGCFMINTLTERALISPAAYQQTADLVARIRAMILHNVKAAQSRAQIKKDLESDTIADTLLTLDQGFSIFGIHRPDDKAKDQIIQLYLDQISS